MASGVVERPAESRAVSEFLLSADRQPSGLVMEGQAGIGKTTLWLAGVAEARDSLKRTTASQQADAWRSREGADALGRSRPLAG